MFRIKESSCSIARVLIFASFAWSLGQLSRAGEFEIKIIRDPNSVKMRTGTDKDGKEVQGNRITGKILANNVELGTTYENNDKKIVSGKYAGKIRTESEKGHCLNSEGTLGKVGDFLIEIVWPKEVKPERTDLLIHGGLEPWHSEGCVMLGAVEDPKGKRIAPEALRKLRQMYFEAKANDPNLQLTIEFIDQ